VPTGSSKRTYFSRIFRKPNDRMTKIIDEALSVSDLSISDRLEERVISFYRSQRVIQSPESEAAPISLPEGYQTFRPYYSGSAPIRDSVLDMMSNKLMHQQEPSCDSVSECEDSPSPASVTIS